MILTRYRDKEKRVWVPNPYPFASVKPQFNPKGVIYAEKKSAKEFKEEHLHMSIPIFILQYESGKSRKIYFVKKDL